MANVFTTDANCVAAYAFESGALLTDIMGLNALGDGGPVVSATCKEGSGSANFEDSTTDYFYISDAGLSEGFPMRAGDASPIKILSICGWFRLESKGKLVSIASKWDTTGKRNWGVFIGTDNVLTFRIGTGGGDTSELSGAINSTALDTGIWYHFGITFNDATKAWYGRVWNDTASTTEENSSTFTNNVNVENSGFCIGGYYTSGSPSAGFFDGLIDELVIFKDLLTSNNTASDEIYQIRAQIYGAAGAPAGGIAMVVRG
jgi:hypothetical protein